MSSSDYSRSPPAFLAKARVVPSLSVQWLDMNEPVQIASSLETTPFLAIVFSFPPNTNPDWVDTILSITNKEPSEHYTTLDASFYRSLPSSSPILSWPDGLFVSFKAIDGFRLHDATVGLPIEPAMAQSLWSSYRDWRNAQEAEMLSETASSGSCSRSSESQMNNDAVSGNSDNVSEVASDWTSFSDIGPTDLLRPTFLELFTFEYSSVSNEDLVCPSLCRIEEEIRAIQTITKSYITRGVPLTISWIEKSECAEIGPAADFRSLAVEQLADPPSLNIEFKDLLSFPVKYPQKQTFVETQSEEEPFELFPEFYAPLRFAQRPGSEALINPVPEKDLRVIFVDVLDLLMVRNECIISVVRSILEHQHVLWDDQSIFSLYLEAESFIFSETEEPPNLRELIKSTLQRVAYVTGFNPSAQRFEISEGEGHPCGRSPQYGRAFLRLGCPQIPHGFRRNYITLHFRCMPQGFRAAECPCIPMPADISQFLSRPRTGLLGYTCRMDFRGCVKLRGGCFIRRWPSTCCDRFYVDAIMDHPCLIE